MLKSSTIERPKTFLDLPPEIRDLIYELVLVETPRYQRRHHATCNWSNLVPSCEDRHLLESMGSIPPAPGQISQHLLYSLLSANRRIYHEASHVLWSKNVFSFARVSSFNQWFAAIGAAKRGIIRHIAIYYVQPLIFREETLAEDAEEQLLLNLSQCTDLRRLDLGPGYLPEAAVATLARRLPRLQHLSMAGYVAVHRAEPGSTLPLAWRLVYNDVRLDNDDDDTVGSSSSSTSTQPRWDSEGIALWHERGAALQQTLKGLDGSEWKEYCDTHSWEEHRWLNFALKKP
ncbi:hypothetical protein PG996_003421 [Apiospora saccharicola]|uniref:DUF7730 domain-containing protein n=1 Tax=Apiospora saccharicola TaxID=335842 RepID=A0ABR1W175_9PEZI